MLMRVPLSIPKTYKSKWSPDFTLEIGILHLKLEFKETKTYWGKDENHQQT